MSQPAKRGRTAWSPPEGVKIDWTRPALHIAKECGVAVTTVINWMRRNGLPIGPRGTPPGTTWTCVNRFDASVLDWRYQDIHLATRHGLCRERIRQLRKAAGLPASGSAAWLAAGGVVTNPPHQGRKSKLAVDGQPRQG
jgi:hypothetical protein